MLVYRVSLNGWVASFRHPQLVTGVQPSFPVPPPSTVYGLVSAAAGRWVSPEECKLAYVFRHEGGAQDLETVHNSRAGKEAKTNVGLREWLTDWRLWLYFQDRSFAEYFEEPVYPLCLGRQQEFAHVERGGDGIISEVLLEHGEAMLQGTVVEAFNGQEASGALFALPLAMTQDVPRQPVGVQPRVMIREPVRTEALLDPEVGHAVCWMGG